MNTDKLTQFGIWIIFIIILVIIGPFIIIWSLNSLFSLNITYTFKHWLATYLLWCAFSTSNLSKGKE